MAKRMRYKQIDQLLTIVLLSDTAVLKVVTAIIALVLSALSLAYLYMIGEFKKARSHWLVMGFAAIILCTLVSLVLNFPSPAPEVAEIIESTIPTGT